MMRRLTSEGNDQGMDEGGRDCVLSSYVRPRKKQIRILGQVGARESRDLQPSIGTIVLVTVFGPPWVS
jgi:hypothetical protein